MLKRVNFRTHMSKLSIPCCLAAILFLSVCTAQKNIPAPLYPIPTAAQLQWHEMEMNAFIHFSTNTFTGKEWGYGDEPAALFDPAQLKTDQWAKVLRKAGFKMMILTAKHHDGFCLWPSAFTHHSVKNSPYKNGKGNIVKEASDAAKKYGLKFGIYLSPWDRNRADYGSPAYITYYRNQLKELFSNYGPVFEMWFDGANGGDGYYGGAKEKREINRAVYYDWPNTLQLVQTMQPNVIFFSDAGPGVRWVGNENGFAGETNWNTISTDTLYAGKPGIGQLLNAGSADGKNWVPAEADVSIRPGWFYHAEENNKVKTADQLFNIYLGSVGRGATLLLNIPPDKRGVLHENDVRSLEEFNALLKKTFSNNLAKKAKVTATSTRGNAMSFAARHITDGNKNTYWCTDDSITTGSFIIELKKEQPIKFILLQEYIRLGQRVQSFSIDAWKNASWQNISNATTIGYKRILPVKNIITSRIRVSIHAAKACPLISNVAVY